MLPKNTVERLSQYRQILLRYKYMPNAHIFSHDLARLMSLTPVQVRRDLMLIGVSGNHRKGYRIQDLMEHIGVTIDSDKDQNVAIIGLGSLGRAITGYFKTTETNLNVIAAFDVDPKKVNKKTRNVYCYHITEMSKIITEKNISIAVLTVPKDFANETSQILVEAGIRGILNFTSIKLDIPEHVYHKEIDMITALEEIAYFSK